MLAALVLTGVLRGIAGPAAGARIASAAIGLGFLLGYYLILGWPPLPPATSTHKLAFVAAAGVCAGLLIDVWAAPAIVIRVAAAVGPALAVGWLGWRGLAAGDWPTIATVLIVGLAAVISLPRMAADGVGSAESAAMLAVAAVALGSVAIIGASASLAQLAVALAASCAGFGVWNWPKPRYVFGAGAALGAGSSLAAIAAAMVLFTEAHPLAVALVVPVLFAAPIARLMPLGQSAISGVLRPIVVFMVAAIPALAAVGAALLLAERGGYP